MSALRYLCSDAPCVCRFQWTRNGVNITGATGAWYSFTAVDADNGVSTFQVLVYNLVRVGCCATYSPQ